MQKDSGAHAASHLMANEVLSQVKAAGA